MWGSRDPSPLHHMVQSSPRTSSLCETHNVQLAEEETEWGGNSPSPKKLCTLILFMRTFTLV